MAEKKRDGKDLEIIKKKKQPVIKYRDNYACGAAVSYVNSPGRLMGIEDARGRGGGGREWKGRGRVVGASSSRASLWTPQLPFGLQQQRRQQQS